MQTQRIQTTSKWDASAGRGSVRVIIIRVQSCVVIEVFLDMNEREIVLRKQLSDARGIRCFVPRDIIAVKDVWKAGDIEG